MRIEDFSRDSRGNRTRVVATVVWEDCDRPSQEIYYETTHEFADDLTCDPHAFLIACILPALQLGERRITISEPIAPELRNNLLEALAWFRRWTLVQSTIQIEVKDEPRYPQAIPSRTGSFLSGGIDSLAILRANRRDFPLTHPRAIGDCLFVHGFDMGGLQDGDAEIDSFTLALNALSSIAKDAQVNLIPVYTNVRHLCDDLHFWIYQFHGAALSSVAHAFSRRLTSVCIASAYKIQNLRNKTTHPLIEPNYSSANLRISVGGLLYSRLERVQMIADWPIALENLRVCTLNPPGELNCGECEKCIRTMLQLLASDCLAKASAFPRQAVRPEMLETLHLTEPYQDLWYGELIEPLAARGHQDLVDIIQEKRTEFRKYLMWKEERDWKGAVKRFDRRYLGGNLFGAYKATRTALGKGNSHAS